ncbi:hypothetical protein [Acidiplasma sp.]|uniref:hypothetical protein n=1 Tax=Acidiplasma sp. TaxID=1872114 RepID=UPI0025828F0F|nr:hypothetical protein [Acidiplasma sp.]
MKVANHKPMNCPKGTFALQGWEEVSQDLPAEFRSCIGEYVEVCCRSNGKIYYRSGFVRSVHKKLVLETQKRSWHIPVSSIVSIRHGGGE